MTRILIVETASPKRILDKLQQIRTAGLRPQPDISILCCIESRQTFVGLPGVSLYTFADQPGSSLRKELDKQKFDILYAFWTGERGFHRIKRWVFRIRASEKRVIAGDGNEFRLTWRAICRHALFRLKHPLPTDHWDFLPPKPAASDTGNRMDAPKAIPAFRHERILVLQSAEPTYVLRALNCLEEKPLFANARYTLFCRNQPAIVDALRPHPLLRDIRIHSEARGSGKHFRELRRAKFDAIVLFLTGDPSYWKLKIFALLLGVRLRRMLIFNESMDCFFFNWSQWLSLIFHRMQSRPTPGSSSRWVHSARILVSLLLKSGMLPFRFFWLLLVWLRLRSAGLRGSRKYHDDSSRLPTFPGA